jgi:hypothetical protein
LLPARKTAYNPAIRVSLDASRGAITPSTPLCWYDQRYAV